MVKGKWKTIFRNRAAFLDKTDASTDTKPGHLIEEKTGATSKLKRSEIV